MTPEERFVAKLTVSPLTENEKLQLRHVVCDIKDQAHAEGYAKGLEDAARVADSKRERAEHINEKDAYDIAWDVCCGEIAAAIRELEGKK